MKLNFNNQFSKLPKEFYTKMNAEIFFENSDLIAFNKYAAKEIGLDTKFIKNISDQIFDNKSDRSDIKTFTSYFSGEKNINNSEPLASVYSGHQFGVWAGQLGDGRALLLGQIQNSKNELLDIQLKGSGKTPYSRFGDGRAVLRSCIREFLCSQAMQALKIPSTKALSIIKTDSFAIRQTPEAACIMTRIAKTHIRFGNFEHFFYKKDYKNLKILVDFTIKNYFKKIDDKDDKKYEKFLLEVIKSTAKLIANWQAIGFCHGVMNTDNMSILGETIDFGPFGFIENFDINHICNSSDREGRYSFKNQPSIALINLEMLAISLQPLLEFEISKKYLLKFENILQKEYKKITYKKLAFNTKETPEKDQLISEFFTILTQQQPDLTLSYRNLSEIFDGEEKWLNLFKDKSEAKNWLEKYKKEIKYSKNEFVKKIKNSNPKFILRNWIAEDAIRQAQNNQNYKPIHDILKILKNPFDEHEDFEKYSKVTPKEYQNLSVSCSS